MRKVSITAFTFRKGACLNRKLVMNPKIKPTVSDTKPRMMNFARTTKIVVVVNSTVYS